MKKELFADYMVQYEPVRYTANFRNCVELVWELQDSQAESDRPYSDETCNALIHFDETGELTNGLTLADCKVFMVDVLELFPEIGAPLPETYIADIVSMSEIKIIGCGV